MGGARDYFKKLFLLSVVISFVLVSFTGIGNAAIDCGCNVCKESFCSCSALCLQQSNSYCTLGYSCGSFAPTTFYQSATNQCAYYEGPSSTCGPINSFCPSGQHFPITVPTCTGDPQSECTPENSSASCSTCGNCDGSGNCVPAACGATNGYGCGSGQYCNGGMGPGSCNAPIALGAPCNCTGQCTPPAACVGTPGICSISTQLVESVSPLSPVHWGTPVTFTCNYSTSSGVSISGANVTLYFNGVNYSTTYTGGVYTYSSTTLPVGNNMSWYCNASEFGYGSQIGANQSYTITALPTNPMEESVFPPTPEIFGTESFSHATTHDHLGSLHSLCLMQQYL